MGMGATRTLERVATSMGALPGGAAVTFSPSIDVDHAGVLFAIPSLLAAGLLTPASQIFSAFCDGFYPLPSLFLLLSFLALSRIPTLEKIRYLTPSEWGGLLGLDRIPEVKTLRIKLKKLAANAKVVADWGLQMSKEWMNSNDDHAGLFYVDGHLRVYSGAKANIPRHFSSRQKLCQRGVVDYWVNAYGGAPLFVVNKELDLGMVAVLRDEIVPRLLTDYQPNIEHNDSENHPNFTMIFDRGGYSPNFFAELHAQNIAVLTYNKFVNESWPESEFVEQQVELVSGEKVEMKLAERPLVINEHYTAREIRRLTLSSHQTSIICTDSDIAITVAAPHMFARWCQENYFKYAMKEFKIDHLLSYDITELPDTKVIVNPAWKNLDSRIKSIRQKLWRNKAKFGALKLTDTSLSPKKMEKFQLKAGELKENIEQMQAVFDSMKAEIKDVHHHVSLAEIPEEQRYHCISSSKKMFVDIIKMIAYRAETSMANILREFIVNKDEVRSILQSLYRSNADIIPDYQQKTLTVSLHYPANQLQAKALSKLAEELTATETVYPGTELTLIYEVGRKPENAK